MKRLLIQKIAKLHYAGIRVDLPPIISISLDTPSGLGDLETHLLQKEVEELFNIFEEQLHQQFRSTPQGVRVCISDSQDDDTSGYVVQNASQCRNDLDRRVYELAVEIQSSVSAGTTFAEILPPLEKRPLRVTEQLAEMAKHALEESKQKRPEAQQYWDGKKDAYITAFNLIKKELDS